MSDDCFHCGDEVIGKPIVFEDRAFCCNGCKGVYQLLKENNLGGFYQMEKGAGTRPRANSNDKYNYLDLESIRGSSLNLKIMASRESIYICPLSTVLLVFIFSKTSRR